MVREYTAPAVSEYGTVESITEQSNKEGLQTDEYTDATNGEIVGSIVPAN